MKSRLKTCARCGKQFKGSARARWCSAACKQAAYRERRDRKIVTVQGNNR